MEVTGISNIIRLSEYRRSFIAQNRNKFIDCEEVQPNDNNNGSSSASPESETPSQRSKQHSPEEEEEEEEDSVNFSRASY